MSPEKHRIAIAEACGWKIENYGPKGYENLYWRLRKPDGTYRIDDCTGEEWSRTVFSRLVPDYLTDLNATHDAVSTLPSDGSWTRFLEELENVTNCAGQPASTYNFIMVNATAAQRAEAFLRTIGKWEDDK